MQTARAFLLFSFFLIASTLTAVLSVENQDSTKAAALDFEKQVREYSLAYPGMLPDNPMYFIKATRDRIVEFLISDPLKKAQFHLLQTDKRIAAVSYLVPQRKESKYVEEELKLAEKYFLLTLEDLKRAKEQNIAVDDTTSRMRIAVRKYQLILTDLQKQAKDEQTRTSLTNAVQKFVELEKNVAKVPPKQ